MKKTLKIVLILLVAVLTCLNTVDFACAAPQAKTKQEAREKIKRLKILEKAEANKLYKNQQKLENTVSTLQTSQKQLKDTQAQLADMETVLANALGEYNRTDRYLKGRLRQIYKSQRKGFFIMLLGAKDINSFIDIMYYESIIIKNDYIKMKQAKIKAKQIALLKYNIEEQKRNLARSIKSINYQHSSIQRAIAQNENMINKLRTDRVAYEKAEKELEQQSASIGTMINRTSSSGSQIKVVSGFVKPISGRITSPFGWRTHPIFNSRTFHSGVDIGGPFKGVIRASNSGKVIYSGWYGGYGKVVIVDHGSVNGKPTTTLYAHMDSIMVNQGEYVAKGQAIGREGTTGYSTGPHVHFEVRVNGKPNNPLNYI